MQKSVSIPLSFFTAAEKAEALLVINKTRSPEIGRMVSERVWFDRSGSPIPIRLMNLSHKKFTIALWLRKYLQNELQHAATSQPDLASTGYIFLDPMVAIGQHPMLQQYKSVNAMWESLNVEDRLHVCDHVVKDLAAVFERSSLPVLSGKWSCEHV